MFSDKNLSFKLFAIRATFSCRHEEMTFRDFTENFKPSEKVFRIFILSISFWIWICQSEAKKWSFKEETINFQKLDELFYCLFLKVWPIVISRNVHQRGFAKQKNEIERKFALSSLQKLTFNVLWLKFWKE